MDDGPTRTMTAQPAQEWLGRETFAVRLLTELTDTLEGVVGLDEASGFGTLVGRRLGQALCSDNPTGGETSDSTQVAAMLSDLMCRLGGASRVASSDDRMITLHTDHCPFGALAVGRELLCVMTSSAIGAIAADHLGYANVEIAQSQARGDQRCVIRLHLDPSNNADGHEFFGIGAE